MGTFTVTGTPWSQTVHMRGSTELLNERACGYYLNYFMFRINFEVAFVILITSTTFSLSCQVHTRGEGQTSSLCLFSIWSWT